MGHKGGNIELHFIEAYSCHFIFGPYRMHRRFCILTEGWGKEDKTLRRKYGICKDMEARNARYIWEVATLWKAEGIECQAEWEEVCFRSWQILNARALQLVFTRQAFHCCKVNRFHWLLISAHASYILTSNHKIPKSLFDPFIANRYKNNIHLKF